MEAVSTMMMMNQISSCTKMAWTHLWILLIHLVNDWPICNLSG